MMELYLRYFILCHGFAIGLGALVVAFLSVCLNFEHDNKYLVQLSFYIWIDWIEDWTWFLGAMWVLVGISFLYGIVMKKKLALPPLLILLGIHLMLDLVGDIQIALDPQYIPHLSWNFSSFLYGTHLATIAYVMLHVGLTTVMLGKLIDEYSQKATRRKAIQESTAEQL
ncbi:uncharacterized protein LOC134214460 [Armigeres subalbatus]|uniref:uncharacterized protein LOC134214460 n=1 Tax=Armigeres subalbatus TaxID=124917 RepID=UPI002ED1C2AB